MRSCRGRGDGCDAADRYKQPMGGKLMMKRTLRAVLAALLLTTLIGCLTPAIASGEPARDVSGDLLLLVDFQNVYLPGNAWACPSMPEAVANTKKILDAENAPDYVMTRFVAPQNPVGRWAQYNEAYRDINEDTSLAEIVDELTSYAAGAAAVAEKSTYSSMDAPEVLAAMEGKRAVVLTGVVADCCVLATMFDAIDLGYEVVYLYDCIGGMSADSEAEIRTLAEVFAPVHTTILSSDEYLAAIGARAEEASS